VSTGHQSLDQQLDAITAAGVDPERIYRDKLSGTSTREERPGLAALLDYARPGDAIVVVGIDCLGRSRRREGHRCTARVPAAVLLTQRRLEYLAGGVAGQFGHVLDAGRALEVGQALTGVADQLVPIDPQRAQRLVKSGHDMDGFGGWFGRDALGHLADRIDRCHPVGLREGRQQR